MKMLPRVDLRFKISQGSRKGFPRNVLQILQGLTKVKCLPPILKREKVVVLMLRSLFVQRVVQNIKVNS